ncbi:MAG: threonine--tRNA ligase [Candidatus Pacebacteria bacterium CG10_big_fil_rev_8_21_14_0_10_36_11]|nr:threonine--tRNA ligase [Candidatus Pacearchaeota archaeon]OIP73978.1 MAG: threonine--tRNA ligase [Candidatus Pacebacteria bacterium CG2_30_36_39]PIR64384.1 MAG: threonine--tRNA ligase [Candidatus Pacebacteria bacterium CG10_big_fil_rev_8_21_14_0_10_36_11]PJC43080.1 MAG: threonine--tRNA ligase [Candidatus Pacebacteria bacterium CG_4_9_14_0_2_um_filter_36_8]
MAEKNKSFNQLWNIRHTAEHVLTLAMQQLYGKDKIIMAMGPATEEGFYFDFDAPADFKISEIDFPKIEKQMKKIIQLNFFMQRVEISVETARKLFADNPYKQEWLNEIEGEKAPVTVYLTGAKDQVDADEESLKAGKYEGLKSAFVDLCSGPHAERVGEIKAFKLLSVAGAYWRGDEKNKMLTRVYGTAFTSQIELDEYVNRIEEAKKRDHRKLGKTLDLFTFSELVGPGLPLWTPKGTQLRVLLDDFVWALRKAKGYAKVEIPHITKKDLYQTSGHWDKFGDELFRMVTREGHEFVMKPMNCPHHTQIFARKQMSYREMPQRYANTTMVYRDEQTGELNGLSRVRAITQDDSHVFCRQTQVQDEANAVWDIVEKFYGAFGFELQVRLSLHNPAAPEKYLGGTERWLAAEETLRELARFRGVKATEAAGEAAFYGPKIDFMAFDSLGREWQVATIQLDFNMPERFDLSCVNEQGEKERIVMLHVAIMGSIERFLSILIEHYGGAFPFWLAPEQVRILPIADRHFEFAQDLQEKLKELNIRVEIDLRSERLPAKIRAAQLEKVPHMIVIGDQELEAKQVNVRSRDGEQQSLSVEKYLEQVVELAKTKK